MSSGITLEISQDVANNNKSKRKRIFSIKEIIPVCAALFLCRIEALMFFFHLDICPIFSGIIWGWQLACAFNFLYWVTIAGGGHACSSLHFSSSILHINIKCCWFIFVTRPLFYGVKQCSYECESLCQAQQDIVLGRWEYFCVLLPISARAHMKIVDVYPILVSGG